MRREIISAFQRNRPHVKIPTRTRVMARNVTKTVNRALYMSPRYVTDIIHTKFQLSTYPSFHSSRGGVGATPPGVLQVANSPAL